MLQRSISQSSSISHPSYKSVVELRTLWKPTKERLYAASRGRAKHPLPIRMHRSLSWLEAIELAGDSLTLDQALIFEWISLNALFGRWDDEANEPLKDSKALKDFERKILGIDKEAKIASTLIDSKDLVLAILEDKFVNRHFWQETDSTKDFSFKRAEYAFHEENWGLLLSKLLDRIYFVRCQLVHGASTFESDLNRKTVARSKELLRSMLDAFLLVIIESGATVDWGDLCYPPISSQQKPR